MKEYFLSCWHLILLSFGMGVAVSPAARAADITFNVNLHYQAQQGRFTLGTDAASVVVGSTTVPLTRSGTDDNVYTGTLTGQTGDSQIAYSYRLTHNGNTVSETVAARKYVVQDASAANVLDDWFDDSKPPYPYADFYASSVKTVAREVVRFFDSSDGGTATNWQWAFEGDPNKTITGSSATAFWTVAGSYNVKLTVDNGGVSTSKTIKVQVVDDKDALGWWNDAVFYQIFPRSFLDSNGDGIGDLAGMTSKLDYLSNELGVTALYIMPVYESTHANYGGYEITNYKSISSEFGTVALYDQFVQAAHTKGMRVIMDMVFNHSSNEHPWFKSAGKGAGERYDDYYRFRSTGGSNWRTNPITHSNQNFNYVWDKFTSDVTTPDLNYNSASIRNAVKDVSSWWLTNRAADGFRLDAPMFLYESGDNDDQQQNQPATYAYWRSWRRHIKATNSQAFSVGETWGIGNIPGMAKYVYQGFDIGFQFDIAYGVEKSLNSESKSDLQSAVEQTVQYYPFLQYGVFTSNHDLGRGGVACGACERRIKDRFTSGSLAVKDAKAKVAAAFVLTAPGVPFVYFGEEVGAGGDVTSRSPMHWDGSNQSGFTTSLNPWLEVSNDYATYNVASEKNDANSIWGQYKQLIALRKAQVALRQGRYTTMSSGSGSVYAYARTAGSETVLVILNMSNTAQNGVSFSVTLPNGVPDRQYTLTNLLGGSSPNPVTVSGSAISNWVAFNTIAANGYYVLKLNATSGPNAAPTLAAIADQTLNLEDGAKAITLTNVTDGDYCGQTLTGSATRANTTVLSAASVSNISCSATTATLTLTPAAVGSSSVTVTLTDNGGTANGGVNTFSRSFTATVTDVPKAPSNLTLSQASPTSVAVGWTDNSSRETGYRVYWSTGSTKPTTANATVAANATSYTATGLSTQTTYNFWVEAYSGNGTSSFITSSITLTLPNLALNKPASASNVETYQGVTYEAKLAVDGIDRSFTNRWSAPVTSAGANQTEWIKVDLGASYNLSKVVISWENANADSYYIMASNSNVTPDPANSAWNKVGYTGLANLDRTDNQSVNLTGRYLAIYCYHKSQQYGYSIYELQAYGLAATGNQAPNASAGPNQALPYTATSTTLDASGSTDPEGSTLSYTWSQTSGPNTATFSSKTVAKPTVSGLAVGSYVFQVSVSDGSLSSTAQVTVTVASSSGGATSYYIINRWKGTYLTDNGSSQVAYTAATTSSSAKWTLEMVGSYERIRNVATGNYMNVENLGANVQCTNVPSSFTSSQWAREAVSGTSYFRIRNNWQSGAYIHVENQTGFAQYGSVDVSFYSGHWTFQSTTGSRSAGPLAATAAAAPASLEVYPNPVTTGRLTVQVPGTAATAQVRLYDAQGRLVLSQTAALAAGQLELSVARCSAGLYLLQVEADGAVYAQKLLVQ